MTRGASYCNVQGKPLVGQRSTGPLSWRGVAVVLRRIRRICVGVGVGVEGCGGCGGCGEEECEMYPRG